MAVMPAYSWNHPVSLDYAFVLYPAVGKLENEFYSCELYL